MIDTTQLEKDLNDPATDKVKIIKNLVDSIDELVAANNEMKRLADEAATISEKSIADQRALFDSVLDLTTALKNVHIILNSGDEATINELKLYLAKWVLSPGAIKLGVVTSKKG